MAKQIEQNKTVTRERSNVPIPIKRHIQVDWQRFAAPLRKEYPDKLIDKALDRLENGDVWEWHGKIGVRVRRAMGDNRTQSGAKSYWPTGDGQWESFDCRCHGMRTRGLCSHALAALMYCEWLDEHDAAESVYKPSLSIPHSATRNGVGNSGRED
jgi:hypothetical protein